MDAAKLPTFLRDLRCLFTRQYLFALFSYLSLGVVDSKIWVEPWPTCGDEGGVSLMPSGVGDPRVSSKSIDGGLG